MKMKEWKELMLETSRLAYADGFTPEEFAHVLTGEISPKMEAELRDYASQACLPGFLENTSLQKEILSWLDSYGFFLSPIAISVLILRLTLGEMEGGN